MLRNMAVFRAVAVALLWASAASHPSGVRGVGAMSQQAGAAEPPESIELVYQKALASSGYRYLEQEAELQQRQAEALPFLRSRQTRAEDAFDRFAAATLADWLEGKPRQEYSAVMAKLLETDERMRETPAAGIRADIVESTMTRIAGNRLVAILALRLGQNALTPPWLERGALHYLHRHGNASILPALTRYVKLSRDEAAREFALKTIAIVSTRK